MGIFGGIAESIGGAVKFASAPLVGAAKFVGHGLETGGKVIGDLATLQPGKAIDDIGEGIKNQAGDIIGVPKQMWHGVKDEFGGLGQTVTGAAKFIGEPVRGAARIIGNDLGTAGSAIGDVATGEFGKAGSDLVGGVGKNFSILGETATNEFHNLF